MKKQIWVVAGIIKNNNEYLCMERSQGKYEYVSYKFEFPGGKIEEGETKEQALIRELQEEMEFEVEIEKPFMETTHEYPDFIITMYVFLCSAKNRNFVMNVHKSFKWLPLEQLETLDWAAADIPVVKKLMKDFA